MATGNCRISNRDKLAKECLVRFEGEIMKGINKARAKLAADSKVPFRLVPTNYTVFYIVDRGLKAMGL